jgi:hypothetical protein
MTTSLKKPTKLRVLLNHVEQANLPQHLIQYIGRQKGKQAPGDRVSVDTQMNESQRDLHPNDIYKWIENNEGVDWNLFGYTTVIRFPDGSLEMINGQHRTQLVKWILPDVQEVPAHIIDTNDKEYAARLFASMNGVDSRKLTTEELFWAQVIGRDPYALYVQKQLKKMNLACGKVNSSEDRKRVKYGGYTNCLKMGEEATSRAVNLIDRAYPTQGMDDQVLIGLTRLLSIKEYQDLADTTLKIGREFDQWFTNDFADTTMLSDARFPQFKNTTQWYNGVAYGIMSRFRHFQKRKNRTSPGVDTIKRIYNAGIK